MDRFDLNTDSKVLIVDDMPENIEMLTEVLNRDNIEIFTALDGNEAIRQACHYLPDLILLDVTMPDVDGFTVCKVLKNTPATRGIPVIFLTAKSDIKSIARGFEVGGIDYITKPFNSIELISRVFSQLELKHSRDTILKQNDKLKQLLSTKDKFLSVITHDLKNPMTVTLGYSQLLFENFSEYKDSQKTYFIKNIFDSTSRQLELMETLIQWYKSQTGLINCNKEELNLKLLVNEVLNFYRCSANDKNISLKADIDDKHYIEADRMMISAVIRNLIGNAIKFTNRNGNVSISSKEINSMIEINVTDNGIGISKENLNMLFNVDTHYSTVGTENEKGTGLGLLICKEFIEVNGGKLNVLSSVNNGSSFIFSTIQSKN